MARNADSSRWGSRSSTKPSEASSRAVSRSARSLAVAPCSRATASLKTTALYLRPEPYGPIENGVGADRKGPNVAVTEYVPGGQGPFIGGQVGRHPNVVLSV